MEQHGRFLAGTKGMLVDQGMYDWLVATIADHPQTIVPFLRGRGQRLIEFLEGHKIGIPALGDRLKVHGLIHKGSHLKGPINVPATPSHLRASFVFVVGHAKDIGVGRLGMLVKSAFDRPQNLGNVDLSLSRQGLLAKEQGPVVYEVSFELVGKGCVVEVGTREVHSDGFGTKGPGQGTQSIERTIAVVCHFVISSVIGIALHAHPRH